MKTREQEYAKTIYEQVRQIKGKSFQEDYKNSAKNLPFLIRSAGLVQALYFVESRNEGSKKLIEDLQAALGNSDLLEEARKKSINEYMLLTDKCLLALKWYKRFVDIILDGDSTQNQNAS